MDIGRGDPVEQDLAGGVLVLRQVRVQPDIEALGPARRAARISGQPVATAERWRVGRSAFEFSAGGVAGEDVAGELGDEGVLSEPVAEVGGGLQFA